MNKTFIKIGAVLALIAMLIFVIPFGLPSRYRVVRTVAINAPPAAIHPSVNTLQEWPEWSAWTTKKYTDLKNTYAGPESGVGAINEFAAASLGGGRKFEVTKSDPDEGIEYKLEFHQGDTTYPSTGGIKYAKEGDGTKVTWTNEGDLGWNPISRWCNAFGLMDADMGPDFETGLTNLKKKVEAEVAAADKTPEPEKEPAAPPPAEQPASEPAAENPVAPSE